MRVVSQNVLSCSLSIDGKLFSHIDKGYLLLVSFTDGDNEDIIKKMVDKIIGMRVFADDKGMTNLSIQDIDGQIMSVSQFTLYADVSHGRRPTFTPALKPELSKPLYDYFNEYLLSSFGKVQTGVFGADMKINFINDGPFTMILDSKEMWGM